MYGYVIAAELLAVAVLNLVDTHGSGAPKHPDTALSALGVAAVAGYVVVLQTRRRFLVGFASMIAALVVNLPKGPNSTQVDHLFAILFAGVYAVWMTNRQRRAAQAEIKNRPAQPAKSAAQRRAELDARRRARRRRRHKPDAPSGPMPNRRYTPPKSRRPRR
jgi:hypothetical protein